MQDVYQSKSYGFMFLGCLIALFVFGLPRVDLANNPNGLFGFAFFVLLFGGYAIYSLVRAFAFPDWAYGPDGFQIYRSFSTEVAQQYEWREVVKIITWSGRGSRMVYLKMVDGNQLEISKSANLKEVLGEVIQHVRKVNPQCEIDPELL